MGKPEVPKWHKGLILFSSNVIFSLALAGIITESWSKNLVTGDARGLWKNNPIKTTPETDGIELVRGTACIAVIISFLFYIFSLQDLLKCMTWWPKMLDFEARTSIMYMSCTTAFYSLIAAAIYSSYQITGFGMGPSAALMWVVFTLSFVTSIYLVYFQMVHGEGGRNDVSAKDENQERGNWDSHTEYLLSMVGYAVGLGNVWRFPYLCYENGGGAFLIPYVIMLVFVGLPVFYMECAIGQFDSRGPIESWNISPAFRGVGCMMVIYSAFVGIYYNVIIAYAIYYFFSSLTSTENLPWVGCNSHWSDPATCAMMNSNTSTALANGSSVSDSEQYFNNHVLQLQGMDEEGAHDINYKIVVSLIVAWTVVFFSLIKGIKSSGKVVWFTALFPYFVILILLIRGCTLPGARAGIDYYIGRTSDLSKLKDINVWRKAASQIFFSLSAGWGGVQALSSYNTFKNNCYKDALIVSIANCCTSVIAGFAIFSILGYMSLMLDVAVPDVVKSSFGLAFIAYPTAMSQIPGGPFWCCLFFLMLFTLGLDSQFTILETVATALCDYHKIFRHNRTALMGALSMGMFLVGLICCTNAGLHWVDLIDSYVGGWAIMMSTVIEIIVLGTVYGGGLPAWIKGDNEPLCEDIEMMIGKRSKMWWFFWKLNWYLISPAIMIGLLIGSWVKYDGGDFPPWAQGVGWFFIVLGLIWLPVYFVIEVVITVKAGKKWTAVFRPNDEWGPDQDQHRALCPTKRYKLVGDGTTGADNAGFSS